MPDQPTPLNRQDLERVAHEALGRQLRLLTGMSALLLVLGFVVGQFTGASLARRNTERLAAQLDQVESKLATLERQLAERRDAQAELEAAFTRVEQQRRRELATDQAMLEAMVSNAEAAGTAARSDLDAYDAVRRTVATSAVRGLVDRLVADEVQSMQRLLVSTSRRLGHPEQMRHGGGISSVPPVAPAPPLETSTARPAPPADPSPEDTERWETPEEVVIVELDPITENPPACRPSNETLVETRATTTTVREEGYLAPPRPRGYLFISPSQPRRMDPDRVSESESVPLPPR